MTPVQRATAFFAVCALVCVLASASELARHGTAGGVLFAAGGAVGLALVVHGTRLARRGVHVDHRPPVWRRRPQR